MLCKLFAIDGCVDNAKFQIGLYFYNFVVNVCIIGLYTSVLLGIYSHNRVLSVGRLI